MFHSNILKGDVALITGGGGSIGFEIVRQLGLHGCCCCIMGRRRQILQSAVTNLQLENINAIFYVGDVRNEDDAAAAVELTVNTFGKLTILINNAAGNFLSPAESLSAKGFKTVMEIDTVGSFNMARSAFRFLKHGGKIINISATLQNPATWYQVHASAAKAAVDSMV